MTLFISKEIDDPDFLSFLVEKNLELCAVSMIFFKSTIFAIPKENEYDAVFFTSPRSVFFFLENVELNENTFIGTIGESTTSFVHQQGYSVHFTGIQSGKPEEVAKSFKGAIGDKKVLFPQSSRSKKTIQGFLKPEQCINLVVYETLLEPVELENSPEILVFTSPSNVEAFLQKNTIDKNQYIIAWGNSTALYLDKIDNPASEVLEESSLRELKLRLQKILD